MAYSTFSDLASSFKEKDYLINIVYDIISLVKENKYALAFELLKKHKVSFSNLASRTQRLKTEDLVKFADYVISHSRNE